MPNILLPPELEQRLEQLARARGKSQGDLVREAVTRFLEEDVANGPRNASLKSGIAAPHKQHGDPLTGQEGRDPLAETRRCQAEAQQDQLPDSRES